MLWAVSQAAPLRRLHIRGNLHLSLGGHCAGGGFVANTLVEDENIHMGSQQQYCLRNCQTNRKVTGGAWSFVLIGCKGDDDDDDDDKDVIDADNVIDGTTAAALLDKADNDGQHNTSSISSFSERNTNNRPIRWAEKPGLINPHLVNEPFTPCRIEKPFLFLDYDSNQQQQLYLEQFQP
jgi:hypothetical protein